MVSSLSCFSFFQLLLAVAIWQVPGRHVLRHRHCDHTLIYQRDCPRGVERRYGIYESGFYQSRYPADPNLGTAKYADSYNWRWLLFSGSVIAVANILAWLKVDESPEVGEPRIRLGS